MIEEPIVLLIDDSSNDTLFMRMAFERAGFVRPLLIAGGGEEAIAYLRGDGGYGNRAQFPLPAVVLLDLNMPRMNGFEVLKWIRQQPALDRMRTYILSASNRLEDVQHAYDLGAASYLVKPANLDELMQMTKSLVAWLKVNHFAPPIHGEALGAAPFGEAAVDQRAREWLSHEPDSGVAGRAAAECMERSGAKRGVA